MIGNILYPQSHQEGREQRILPLPKGLLGGGIMSQLNTHECKVVICIFIFYIAYSILYKGKID